MPTHARTIAIADEAPAVVGTPPAKELLTIAEVCHIAGLGETTIRKLMLEGFPRPIKIGWNTRWSAREVHEWIDRRLAEAERS